MAQHKSKMCDHSCKNRTHFCEWIRNQKGGECLKKKRQTQMEILMEKWKKKRIEYNGGKELWMKSQMVHFDSIFMHSYASVFVLVIVLTAGNMRARVRENKKFALHYIRLFGKCVRMSSYPDTWSYILLICHTNRILCEKYFIASCVSQHLQLKMWNLYVVAYVRMICL